MIDVGIKDQNGTTALMYAAEYGHADVIAIFVNTAHHMNMSLNIDEKNNEGLTAMDLALMNGHEVCSKLLTKQISPPLVLQEVTSDDFVQTPSPAMKEHTVITNEKTEEPKNLPLLSEPEHLSNGDVNRIRIVPATPEKVNGNKQEVRPSEESISKTPRILPLLSLNHVGQVGKNLQPGDSWEWDLGAASARFKMVKCRALDTGSRSLNDSRGRLSDNMNGMKVFSSAEQVARDIRTSSSLDAELILKPPNTEMRLPPIGSKGSAYKKTLFLPAENILKQEDSDRSENVATSA